MQQSSEGAALCLRDAGASACTDVTGFGLLGHLAEMARASQARPPVAPCHRHHVADSGACCSACSAPACKALGKKRIREALHKAAYRQVTA